MTEPEVDALSGGDLTKAVWMACGFQPMDHPFYKWKNRNGVVSAFDPPEPDIRALFMLLMDIGGIRIEINNSGITIGRINNDQNSWITINSTPAMLSSGPRSDAVGVMARAYLKLVNR